jgi:hypothetical protein
MVPHYLIWMTTTRSKLIGMRAQGREGMQTSHKWHRKWICHLTPHLLPPHCLGPTPRTLLKGNGGGKGEQIQGEP